MTIECKLVPKRLCINLFGIYFTGDKSWIDEKVVNHERIHTAQMREMLFVGFYIAYLLEWMVRILQYRNWDRAYRNLSFEREAYANGDDLTYLPRRKFWAWTRYLKQPKTPRKK